MARNVARPGQNQRPLGEQLGTTAGGPPGSDGRGRPRDPPRVAVGGARQARFRPVATRPGGKQVAPSSCSTTDTSTGEAPARRARGSRECAELVAALRLPGVAKSHLFGQRHVVADQERRCVGAEPARSRPKYGFLGGIVEVHRRSVHGASVGSTASTSRSTEGRLRPRRAPAGGPAGSRSGSSLPR